METKDESDSSPEEVKDDAVDMIEKIYSQIAADVSAMQQQMYIGDMIRNPRADPYKAYVQTFDAAVGYYEAAFKNRESQKEALRSIATKMIEVLKEKMTKV